MIDKNNNSNNEEESDNEAKSYVQKFEDAGYQVFCSELKYIRKKRNAIKKTSTDKSNQTTLIEPEKKKELLNSSNDQVTPDPNTDKPSTKHNLLGLCLSGGGIRSATFNLGFLQGLFHQGILKRIDYLSTVSGGGYIGSCFTALFNSDLKNCFPTVNI